MENPLTKENVIALLGRPLTTPEDSNFELYLNIAKLRLQDLTCLDFEKLGTMPDDLALVWALFFSRLSEVKQSANGATQKRVEDFYITYNTEYDPFRELVRQESATIAKYSKCGSGIRHGKTLL